MACLGNSLKAHLKFEVKTWLCLPLLLQQRLNQILSFEVGMKLQNLYQPFNLHTYFESPERCEIDNINKMVL